MPRHLLRTATARLGAALVGAIAVVEWALAVAAPEGGPLGVVQILAPHLAIAGLVAIPFSLIDRRPVAGIASLALLAVTILRFSGDWVSLPAPPAAVDATRIEVATWNLEVASRPGAESVAFLDRVAATIDVVALQELQPDAAAAIEADPALRARFPHRVLEPRAGVDGLGLLSRYPILAPSFSHGPIRQEATLDLGRGRRLAIVHAHPFHADIALLGTSRLPVGLDVASRNADLVALRRLVDERVSTGAPTLLIGDLNTAASEPAFERLVRGLRDVHAEVGEGTGWTWRPVRLEFLGLGVLRIDHVIASPAITPLSIGGVCPSVGDHCLVRAALAMPGA
jgi:endonuclease/exonuclease/phosphatase (EEP) superfamily protein YafD